MAGQAASFAFKTDTYAWETAANTLSWDKTCTSYPGDDDKATISFTGGFTFTIGGIAYGKVQVLSNGVLQFVASDSGFQRSYTNSALPAGKPTSASGCSSCNAPAGAKASFIFSPRKSFAMPAPGRRCSSARCCR